MAKSTVGALSPPLTPLLFSPCSDLAGAEQRRDGREKAHAFTSASHAYKEEKSNYSDMHACAHACISACLHTAHTHIHTSSNTKRDNNENVWEEKHWMVWRCEENTFSLKAPLNDQQRKNIVTDDFIAVSARLRIMCNYTELNQGCNKEIFSLLMNLSVVCFISQWFDRTVYKISENNENCLSQVPRNHGDIFQQLVLSDGPKLLPTYKTQKNIKSAHAISRKHRCLTLL